MDRVLAYIEEKIASYKHYHEYWNYEDGCVLLGAWQVGEALRKGYWDFILGYLDPLVRDDGIITNYEVGAFNIDGFNCGKILFKAYSETCQERYRKAASYLRENLALQPRTASGSFWHKAIYPGQVWLDGLYMSIPFYAEYESRFGGGRSFSDIKLQFENVRRLMFNEEKKLHHHGYDSLKTMFWADKETGLSKSFWLRSIGWHLMALIDTIEACTDEGVRSFLSELLQEAASGLLVYEDMDTGLFWQVVDQPELPGNYTETSGSSMAAYAFLKGARLKALDGSYMERGMKIVNSIAELKLTGEISSGLKLSDICKVAGLGPDSNRRRDGSASYYVSEPKANDDAKGFGPFMMAYAEKLKQLEHPYNEKSFS
ncbi:MAG: glycoside hydrolase family 88 protein [Clostridiales bacterium]|jgi:unsaturated rhamnogalacturonyl hydrolase|nr:glycoside hydrolase family 88 protein [Clostridiales bacterium]